MAKFYKTTFLVFCLLFIGTVGFATETRICPVNDLTYSGAFKLPAPPSGYHWKLRGDTGGYNYGGATYYDAHGTLLIMGGAGSVIAMHNDIAEIGLGTLAGSDISVAPATRYSSLNSGTLNPNSWTNPFCAVTPLPNSTCNDCWLGDMLVYPHKGTQTTDKIYLSMKRGYSETACNACLSGPYSWAELDFNNFVNVGQWKLTDSSFVNAGKYLFFSPDSWATSYTGGRSLIGGYERSGGSPKCGPTMYAFAPWLSCGGSPVNCDTNPPPDGATLTDKKLLEYDAYNLGDTSKTLVDAAHTILRFSPQDTYNDAVWVNVGGKNAVVMLVMTTQRQAKDYRYSYGTHPVYASHQGSSYYSGAHRALLLFFDPSELATVAGGGSSYVPQPYATMDIGQYLFSPQDPDPNILNGLAYDSSGHKLYLVEVYEATNPTVQYDAVHCFTISDTGTALDITPPSAPVLSLTSATKTQVALSWTASTDNSNCKIYYELYKNGFPFAITTSTTFTDTCSSYLSPPVEYYAVARDSSGNETASNKVYVDDSNNGNKPMMIFIPTICPSNQQVHETSYLPVMRPGTNWSYTPTVIGGVPPYTWTISSGLPITVYNSSTGELRSTTHSLPDGQFYRGTLTVTDSATPTPNVYSRYFGAICKTYASSGTNSGYDDKDQDGVTSATDLDDNNCFIKNAGVTYTQPAVNDLAITAQTDTSISLSWTPVGPAQLPRGSIYYRNFEGEVTYQANYGSSTGNYTSHVYVGRAARDGNGKCIYTLSGLTPGPYYLAVTAYDFRGLQSAYSNEVPQNLSPLSGQVYGAYYAEGEDNNVGITECADGGVALASYTMSYTWLDGPSTLQNPNNDTRNVFIVKTHANGTENWRRVIGVSSSNITTKQYGATNHHDWWATNILQTGTDDLIVCGYEFTVSEGVNASLYKLDASGNLTWHRSINRSGANDDMVYDVVERTGGGFALAGSSHVSSTDAALFLTDSSGQNVTITTYNTNGKGSGSYDQMRRIRKTSDGGYIMAGETYLNDGVDNDYYVVKTNSSGVRTWSYSYDNAGRVDRAFGVEEDASGNFWVTGRSQISGTETTSIWIVELDSSGSQLNSYMLGDGISGHAFICRNSKLLSNGNLLVVGYTNSVANVGYEGYLAEVYTSGLNAGTAVWTKTIGVDTGNHEDYLQQCVVSADGNHYLCSGTNNGAITTAYDLWFLKLSTTDRSVENHPSGLVSTVYYYDKDLDGHGNNNQWNPATATCLLQMPGYVTNHDDNNDTLPWSQSAPTYSHVCGPGTTHKAKNGIDLKWNSQ